MATENATQTSSYTYEEYLTQWQAAAQPGEPLSPADFEATLARYLGFTQQIGAAYKGKQNHLAEKLRTQRRPLKEALLI